VRAEREQIEAAIEVFKALARDHPELPEPYNNLAVLYAARGDYEQARDALLSAINTHSSYATAHENLGDIYAKMAGQAYSRAPSLDTDNRVAQQKLALIDDLFMRRSPESRTASVARAIPAASAPATALPSPIAEPVTPVASRTDPAAAPAPRRADTAPATAVGAAAAPPDRTVPALSASPAVAAAPAVPRTPGAAHGGAIEAIQSRAAAWSAQDVPRYLSHYAAQQRPDAQLGRQEWEAQRRARLTRSAAIKVDVDNFQVRSAGFTRVRRSCAMSSCAASRFPHGCICPSDEAVAELLNGAAR